MALSHSKTDIVLYGSKTSPYVRRLRMYLHEQPYQFKEINYLDPAQNEQLKKINPIMKIPVLVHGNQVVFESRVIQRYLAPLLEDRAFSFDEENILSMMDGALDSLINLFLIKRSGVDINNPSYFYFERQRERVGLICDELTKYLAQGQFFEWNYLTQSLYSFLDWASFREFLDLNKYPDLKRWVATQTERPDVKATDPRLAV